MEREISVSSITLALGRNYSTLSREIRRGQSTKQAEKKRIGDWEGDLIMGNRGDGAALVTLVDRASKYTVIGLVFSKKADEVRNEIITMMTPMKAQILTMTYDNGREFAHHQSIAGSLEADTYFRSLSIHGNVV